jgi:hypothetical protein
MIPYFFSDEHSTGRWRHRDGREHSDTAKGGDGNTEQGRSKRMAGLGHCHLLGNSLLVYFA